MGHCIIWVEREFDTICFPGSENDIISIPKAPTRSHVIDNDIAASLILSPKELEILSSVFRKPSRKTPLDIV
jgi:diketogulonate reductase-like aldo/keto reductase